MNNRTTVFDTSKYPDLLYGDSTNAYQKLHRFRAAGARSLHVVADWDNTLTIKKAAGIEGLTWAILKRHMTPANQNTHRLLYEQYHPKEKTGTMTEAEAVAWQVAALHLLIGLPIAPIEHDAIALVKLRKGTRALFDLCKQHDIPTVIKSAGVRQVINTVCSNYGLEPSLTHATKLLVTDGVISGWDEKTLTHAINKERFNHLTKPDTAHNPHIILLGDDLQDARMVAGEHNVLRIRTGGGRLAHNDSDAWQQYLQASYAVGYDLVIESDSLSVVSELISWILQSEL